jgi:Lipid A disaccharide synthetase
VNRVVICTELIEVFSRAIHEEIMKIYVAGVKAYPNLEFIIKVHPKELEKEYLETFNRNDFPNVKVVKDINLHKLYEKCDIQVSVNSTSTLEAAAMGVPTITVAPESIYQKITDLFKGKINIRVKNSQEFISAIEKARTKEHREIFLTKRHHTLLKLCGPLLG